MRPLALALALSLTVALAGCEATIPEGRFACEEDADCPEGWVCRADRGRCYTTPAPEPDGG